jgi:speckle-type POZ protein
MDYVGDKYSPNDDEIKQCTYSISDNSNVLDFIEREDLESLRKGDCFQVRCDVSIVREFPAVPSPDLHLGLGDLLATGLGGDVTFDVGGELFTGHKYILTARSSVFMADLLGQWREKTTISVRIDDMESEVFKALLHFIYTDSLNVVVEDGDKVTLPQHLLVVAHKYNMERLKSICEDQLCNNVDASMAATTLMLADKYGCHELKEACITFLTNLLASVQGPAAGQGSNQRLLTGKRQRC